MRTTWSASIARSAAYALMMGAAAAPAVSTLAAQDPQQPYAQTSATMFSADQLDNLVAPVALYADPLLAQVLLAATFPDQIVNAAQYVRTNGTTGIDDQYWDVSVKAVAHYPTVLNMMDQKIDWTTSLGQAYAQQSTDVMQAVQHMRQLANDQGNLRDSQQQQVVYADGNIAIWPAQARYIYVPVYDPSVIYCRPIYVRPSFTAYWGFGIGYPIGAWLMYDYDWPARRIVYTGWYGGGWIGRSRPYVSITNVYVNAGYRHVNYGQDVIYRRPDYGHVRVYGGIGHDVTFRDHDRGGRDVPSNHGGGQYAQPHGVVTPGGYREPQTANGGSHAQGSTGYQHTPRAMPAPAQPQSQGRTARPSAQPYQPMTSSPVHVRPQAADRPQQAQPRYAEPRYAQPRPDVRSSRPSAPAPAPQAHVRTAPPPSHAAPSPSRSAPSQGRTAHRRGGGNE